MLNGFAYLSLNPVRAGLVERATDWPRSSVHAHLAGRDDAVTTLDPVLSRTGGFAAFLAENRDDGLYARCAVRNRSGVQSAPSISLPNWNNG